MGFPLLIISLFNLFPALSLQVSYTVAIADQTVASDSLFHLTATSAHIDEAMWLNIAYRDAWRYHPGDNMEWADPDFDDSDWQKLQPGGLSITEMTETFWNGYGWWRLTFTTVQDNGPGIPVEIKDKILQLFFTTKKGTQGMGLGLSITHDIKKAHGGTIKIFDEEGCGTLFRIQLPLQNQ